MLFAIKNLSSMTFIWKCEVKLLNICEKKFFIKRYWKSSFLENNSVTINNLDTCYSFKRLVWFLCHDLMVSRAWFECGYIKEQFWGVARQPSVPGGGRNRVPVKCNWLKSIPIVRIELSKTRISNTNSQNWVWVLRFKMIGLAVWIGYNSVDFAIYTTKTLQVIITFQSKKLTVSCWTLFIASLIIIKAFIAFHQHCLRVIMWKCGMLKLP